MENNIERPKNCGECARFIQDKDDHSKGYCDEWPCVLSPDCVCHPNIGRKKKKEGMRLKQQTEERKNNNEH